MLDRMFLNSSATALQFVGGAGNQVASGETPSFSIASLSGGVSSVTSAGDLVVVCVSFHDSTDRTITCSTSGYTQVAELYNGATRRNQLGVFYKVLSSREDSVSFTVSGTTSSIAFVAHVWRNVNSTPVGASATLSNQTGIPNAPAVTTSVNNAIVLAIGSESGNNSTAILQYPTSPLGMQNFAASRWSSSLAVAVGMASALVPLPQTYDPAAFGGFSSNSSNGNCSVTIELRPAGG